MSFLQSLSAALTPTGLIWTLLLISVATFLHELAHYALARWQGVRVNSFSIGMGPIIFKRPWRGTEWRLSLLPIGGYVEIDGMAPEEVRSNEGEVSYRQATRGFAALPAWGKIAVLLAGPLMNLLLAIGLMTLTFSSQGIPAPDRARIESVQPGSRAQTLGLQTGDVITAIDGQDIPDTLQVDGRTVTGWENLRNVLGTPGPHTFRVERAGPSGAVEARDVTFDWTPTVNGQRQLLGIGYGPDIVPVGVGTALQTSLTTTAEAVPQVLRAFGNLFGRFLTLNFSQDENVTGPIGTTEIVGRAAALSPWALVQVATLLNLSLAFFNLIPIPGLDGGRILLVLVGVLRRRPLSFSQEQAINVAGFAFVLLLMTFVVVRDVSRFF
ncbi:M50 family metallopeptidase [Deinococcus radiopugnans]|uniref:Regulator of sigma E protease n=1 Tax=Deinococcus radiopugnans ATCC 19172 TaxID=585398 RepID=A0A5C4XWD5_9DEIO|nr:M50 family metallopeptidase [Deinococcus radiopugnans]MBB6018498.1 regulator of sigma E protease [Deinococcus radiopugnans ATCC 19172]QLG11129.1 site-2 protease family protein [Deinococcus sp. D7000]TNM67499.1 site-2 protease family protein [Deinococcus radiopugnans ATCC 19172]